LDALPQGLVKKKRKQEPAAEQEKKPKFNPYAEEVEEVFNTKSKAPVVGENGNWECG
jgi:hypothetical protein